MLSLVFFQWCEAKELAADQDPNIPDDYACPITFDPRAGRGIAIQFLDASQLATTVRFFGQRTGNVEAKVQEWTDEEEVN